MVNRGLVVGAAIAVLVLAAQRPVSAAGSADHVRLLGETTLPHAMPFDGTTVGGLSGVDFNPRTGAWVLISDDRSDKEPARFYSAKIPVRPDGVGPVELTAVRTLLRPDGTPYPPLEGGDGTTVDPEEIRFDPWSNGLWWSNEGDRLDDRGAVIDPSIRAAEADGRFGAELALPPNVRMTPDTGPRRNESIEGMTFAANGSLVVSSVEGPLLQDGESPTVEHGALVRLTAQDRNGQGVAQHAYPVDRVFATSPTGGFANNGVVSILPVDQRDPFHYLVMERSFVTGVGNSIRIYEIDTLGASDVKDVLSLPGADIRPVRKHLVADLAQFPQLSTVDNVEGMAWGPRQPSGERSLVLVSDDNFSDQQTTQIIALRCADPPRLALVGAGKPLVSPY
jgi:3-phytase